MDVQKKRERVVRRESDPRCRDLMEGSEEHEDERLITAVDSHPVLERWMAVLKLARALGGRQAG